MQLSDGTREPPRLAAKNWEEFSGKQTLLSTFFGKKGEVKSPPEPASPAADIHSPAVSSPVPQVSAGAGLSTPTQTASTSRAADSLTKKRALSKTNSNAITKKKAKKDPSQQTLGSFFSKPSAKSVTPQAEVIDIDSDAESRTLSQSSQKDAEQDQLEADYRLACELAASQEAMSTPSSTPPSRSPSESKTAWSNLFTPVQPPNCTAHGEPAKKYTVNKPGPNKGRMFYLCSRYVFNYHPAVQGLKDPSVAQPRRSRLRQGERRAVAARGQSRVPMQLFQMGERCEARWLSIVHKTVVVAFILAFK